MADSTEIDIYIRAGIYGFIFVFGIIGNIFVMCFFAFKMKRAPAFRWFVIHLAIADCICSVVSPVQKIYLLLNNEKWHAGLLLCQVTTFLGPITVNVSALVLCMMAYERYRAICHPFSVRFSAKQIHLFVALIWSICVAVKVPVINLLVVDGDVCTFNSTDLESVLIALSFLLTESLIPLVFLVFFMAKIYQALKMRSEMFLESNNNPFYEHIDLIFKTSCDNLMKVEQVTFSFKRALSYQADQQSQNLHLTGLPYKRTSTNESGRDRSHTVRNFLIKHSIIHEDTLHFGLKNKSDRATVSVLFISVVLFFVTSVPYNVFYFVVIVIYRYVFTTEEDFIPHYVNINISFEWLGVLLLSNSIINMFIYGGKFPDFRHQMYLWFQHFKKKIYVSGYNRTSK